MKRVSIFRALVLVAVAGATSVGVLAQTNKYARDPKQPVDEEYTKKIKEYTTEPFFLSPLVDYLPASKTVPDAEGRARRCRRRARQAAVLARKCTSTCGCSRRPARPGQGLLDRQVRRGPRDDRRGDRLRAGHGEARREPGAAREAGRSPRRSSSTTRRPTGSSTASVPVYYITGSIHAPETGAPTALMELAYRLAVDESAYIKAIRNNVITLITPVVEDGRPRPPGGRLQLAPRASEGELAARRLLGQVRRARQQPRRDGRHAGAHAKRDQLRRRAEGAGAARPARVGAVPVRQHRRRRPVQRLGRSDPDRRVADDRLEQHVRDDQVRHARRVRARHVRHLVAGLPDVHRARCTTASAACTRRSATAAPTRSSASCSRTTTRAPGTSRTRRCRRRCGRSGTTTTTSRPAC